MVSNLHETNCCILQKNKITDSEVADFYRLIFRNLNSEVCDLFLA